MKIRVLGVLLVLFLAICCKPDSYYKETIMLNLTTWNFPDTVKVLEKFDLSLSTQIKSSCISNPEFAIDGYATNASKIYAYGLFEYHNSNCTDILLYKDTTLSVSIKQAGKYYLLFLKDDKWKVDSIMVLP